MGDGDSNPDSDSDRAVATRLARQADDVITADTDWIALAAELDTSLYRHDDPLADNGKAKPFRPMFLAYLWALVEGVHLSAIPDELPDDVARAFGFDPHDMPDPSTFRRLRLNRFEDLKSTLEVSAEHIRNLGVERGSPIGLPFPTYGDTDGEDDPEPTKRTINRMLRRNGKQVIEELKDGIIPDITLPESDDDQYNSDDLLLLATIAAIKQQAANGAGETLGDIENPDPDILDDPETEDGPSGETFLETVKEMTIADVTRELNAALRKTYTRAKPRLEELDQFDTNVMLAFDITYVAYWGETDGMEWLQGAPDDKEYRWCHKFATAVIVGENTHYTVAVCPLGNVDYTDNALYPGNKEKSYRPGDVARRLMSIATDFVDIRMVYADREFYAADVLHMLEARGLRYVIPAKTGDRLERKCDRFDRISNGLEYDRNDTKLYVQNGYSIYGPVKGKSGQSQVETNLVILPPDEDDDVHDEGEPQPFVTNTEVGDRIRLDRVETKRKIERYSNRGAIENTYQQIKECAGWTSSKEFEIRWFHFAFGCIAYNLWLLVDFLVQDRIGVIETRTEPRITKSRFFRWLDRVLHTLI